jgi:potassium efflux system protein
VLFRGFGDSSLNFELRFFIRNVDQRLATQSDLNFAIEKGLREAGIEIPFPQRDLHLRSMDSAVRFGPPPE